jgi:acyl-coenzyme A thioesterase PaaI-like protein
MDVSAGGDPTPSLSALGASGRTGLHVLADALGVCWIAVGGGACELRLAESPLLAETRESVLAISVAADVCGCNAARSAVAVGARISTTGLSLSLLREPEPGELTAGGAVHGLGEADGGRGRPFASAVRIADSAGPLATGLVTGRVGHGERLPPLPWEDGDGAARRRTLALEVVAALRRVDAAPGPRTRTMLAAERVDGGAEFELAIAGRPLLHNRVGHLQGGVAPAIADLAARDLLRDRGRPVLRALQWSFRGPVVEAERLRFEVAAGERSAHVTVSATEGGRLRGAGILEYGT